MLEKLLAALRARPRAAPAEAHFDADRAQIAVVALLVEVSQIDHSLSGEERATVLRLARERFALDQGAAKHLLDLADETLAAALEDWIFTKTIRDEFRTAERIDVVRMLWEVALSDGRLRKFEQNLIERIAGALDLTPESAEIAHQEAITNSRSGRK